MYMLALALVSLTALLAPPATEKSSREAQAAAAAACRSASNCLLSGKAEPASVEQVLGDQRPTVDVAASIDPTWRVQPCRRTDRRMIF